MRNGLTGSDTSPSRWSGRRPAVEGQRTVERLDPRGQTRQAGPRAGLGTTDTVVGDGQHQLAEADAALDPRPDLRVGRLRVGRCWPRPRCDEVRRASRSPRQRSGQDRSTSPGPVSGRRSRGRAASSPRSVSTRGWIPRDDRPQIGERGLGLTVSRRTSSSPAPSPISNSAVPSVIVRARSCCWTPSWRSRSIRCRSASNASTNPARDCRTCNEGLTQALAPAGRAAAASVPPDRRPTR